MADKSILSESKALYTQAESLYEKAYQELDALQQAITNAQELVSYINVLSRKNIQAADELITWNKTGRTIDFQISQIEKTAFDLRQSLEIDISSTIRDESSPYLVMESLSRQTNAPFPSLPDFSVPNKETLESSPIIAQQNRKSVWDEFARTITTFEETIENTFAEINKQLEIDAQKQHIKKSEKQGERESNIDRNKQKSQEKTKE
jgi:hypothetical protein